MSVLTSSVARLLERSSPTLALRARAQLELRSGEPELHLVRELADGARLAVDVGASHGVYAFWMSRSAHRTIAIEPHPDCAALLRRALGSKVEVLEVALSSVVGVATLSVPVVQGALNTYRSSLGQLDTDGCHTVDVRTNTLDSLELVDLDLVKIDVEGHELDVLEGAVDTFALNRPTVLIEAEERHRPGVVAEVHRSFEERDYSGFFIFRSCLRSVSTFDAQIHQSEVPDLGVRTDTYANNFLFIHRSRTELLRKVGRLM